MKHDYLPEPIREQVERISDAVCDMNLCLALFSELSQSKGTVAMLNATAPAFFGTVQRMLVDRIILSACRLADPQRANSRVTGADQERLTIESLYNQIVSGDQLGHPEIPDLKQLRKRATHLPPSFKEHRNHRIAHSDREKACDGFATLTPVTFAEMSGVIASFTAFLNALHAHFGDDREVCYEGPGVKCEAGSILFAVRDAQAMLRLHLDDWQLADKLRADVDAEYRDCPEALR